MILKDLILRIRSKCPVFENRVFGSAQLEEGIRQAETIPVPSAFVMVDGDFPDENLTNSAAVQAVQERWTIVVVVSNKDDNRGQFASDKLHTVRAQLMAALIGWENVQDESPDPIENDWGPVVYRGGLHIDMSSARLWHQYSFGHTIVFAGGGPEYEKLPVDPATGKATIKPIARGGPQPIPGMDGLTAEDFEDFDGEIYSPEPRPPHKRPY